MIKIAYERDELLPEFTKATIKERYMVSGEVSPQDTFARASMAFADDEEHAQRLYDYCSKLWFMYSTPILSNGGTTRGLPISCNVNYIHDSRQGLIDNWAEDVWLTSNGAGIGTYIGGLRSSGTKTSHNSSSTGSIPFLKVIDSVILSIMQGETRRGSVALYQDISHPEIEEFLHIRKPTGGDMNRRCLNIHHAVNITDKFMEIIERCMYDKDADDSWELIDPHTQKVVDVVSAKELWETILTTRVATGEPFLHFIDTSNRALPKALKDKGLRIYSSQLCSEIFLPTTPDRTAVCCLSSVNLEYFDQWKDTQMVRDIIRMLDNVITKYVEVAPKTLWRAISSAYNERSLGLGAMGFHAYLQSKNIPFESPVAKSINKLMFSKIREQAEIESAVLGIERGSAPDLIGGEAENNWLEQWVNGKGLPKELKNKPIRKRNSHLMAVAPNASSSILCGNTSPSIEPFAANAVAQVTLSGTNILKNKYLDNLLKEKEVDDIKRQKIWQSIVDHEGSVQHLKILTDDEKAIFKTAQEIDQRWIIEHAGDRQSYIDQGQSVNLFMPSNVNVGFLHHVHFMAWKKGLKSLYYMRTDAERQVEKINTKVERFKYDTDECIACEG